MQSFDLCLESSFSPTSELHRVCCIRSVHTPSYLLGVSMLSWIALSKNSPLCEAHPIEACDVGMHKWRWPHTACLRCMADACGQTHPRGVPLPPNIFLHLDALPWSTQAPARITAMALPSDVKQVAFLGREDADLRVQFLIALR